MRLIDFWHPPIWLSPAVIVGVLAATAVLSLYARPLERDAHASRSG
jgi:hypothetical protein